MSGEPRPGLGATWRNFRDYDAPLGARLRMLLQNNWRKLRTRRDCCGNAGEPGC